MKWVNSASGFVKVHFGVLMGQIQSGSLLLANTLLKNLCNIQTMMSVNSVSWFVKVKFIALMRIH